MDEFWTSAYEFIRQCVFLLFCICSFIGIYHLPKLFYLLFSDSDDND